MQVVSWNAKLEADFNRLQSESNEVFSSDSWTSAYDAKLRRFVILDDSEKVIGGFVAYEGGMRSIKTLVTPPFASHCGLFINAEYASVVKKNSMHKKIMQAIADFLANSNYSYYKLDFPEGISDMQPFVWKKMNVNVKYSYVLDCTVSEEILRNNLDPKLRNVLNKFEKDNWKISHDRKADEAYQIITSTLGANDVKWKDEILKKLLQESCLNYTSIESPNSVVAVAITANSGNKAYYVFGGVHRDEKNNSLGPAALYNAILFAKQNNKVHFDFEGSMIPEIERYFRQFGGELVAQYSINGGRGLWPRLIQWRNK
jgi:lipid II:glycine glycyltransferase (peptidoglycan interpeptide bridge formation enzyme)